MKLKKSGIVASTLVVALGLSACGQSNGNKAEPSADKPFAGQKLTVFALAHPWTDGMKASLGEFESATGIKVDLQVFPEEQLQQKLAVQFTSGAQTPDVFTYRPFMEKLLYDKNGWTEPLDGYVTKDAGYTFDDFSKASVDGSMVNGKLMSIPLWTDQFVMYYRKDLLEQNNIPVPKTLTEFEAAVKKLNDPSKDFYGFVSRGQRNALVSAAASFIYSEGGDFIVDGKAAINTPEAIRGLGMYANLLKNYGPKGALNMGWPQAAALFAQGKAAFYVDASALYNNTTDPEKSLVADKVGFAPFPAGSAGQKPYAIAAWALAMNPKSEKKDAAWAFMEWSTNKENVLRIQQSGVPGARDSVWASPNGIEKFPADLAAAIKTTMSIGVDHSVPQVMSVTEARDAVGSVVVKAMLGEDINAAAETANKELQAIIDSDNKK
ncbi:ABC transporter substrate-binding protein [Cohnella faecalis]|uniref:Sugar ABC transporter substrate-binding protein n=1 Tax=Cohnella faecalis TaxID=2315694 RepID=A0A398CJX5_9BACL|nr:sugar ABC transporter substrate-binding protein [Cohnella faecalis]RIE03003.1 sugar ABC transporter substrate-binding protein [Cohnella faecalis]